eukprot:194828_1
MEPIGILHTQTVTKQTEWTIEARRPPTISKTQNKNYPRMMTTIQTSQSNISSINIGIKSISTTIKLNPSCAKTQHSLYHIQHHLMADPIHQQHLQSSDAPIRNTTTCVYVEWR